MIFRILADAVVLLHLAFVLFVVLGGIPVIRRPWFAWVHLPALVWGGVISFTGAICPLTPLENDLRRLGGEHGYDGGFVAHYVLPVLYPEGLTRRAQIGIGVALLIWNVAIYTRVLLKRRHERATFRGIRRK